MDHLLFLIFDVNFLVKISSSTYVHFGNFYTAKLTAKNQKMFAEFFVNFKLY